MAQDDPGKWKAIKGVVMAVETFFFASIFAVVVDGGFLVLLKLVLPASYTSQAGSLPGTGFFVLLWIVGGGIFWHLLTKSKMFRLSTIVLVTPVGAYCTYSFILKHSGDHTFSIMGAFMVTLILIIANLEFDGEY